MGQGEQVDRCDVVAAFPQVLVFPLQMLIRFWINHHLLDIFQRPLWRVVKGRSDSYVKRVCQGEPRVTDQRKCRKRRQQPSLPPWQPERRAINHTSHQNKGYAVLHRQL